MSNPTEFPRPILLGHRGARKYSPENTIAAFSLALDHGCDGFEFDVRSTSDRHSVVCHDPKLGGLELATTSLEQLAKETKKKHFEVLSLDAVLERFASRAFLNVELKVSGMEEITIEALHKNPPQKGCIVSSFLPEVVERLGKLGSGSLIGLICENTRQMARAQDLPIQALMLERKLVTTDLVNRWRDQGKLVFTWTVNSQKEMLKLAQLGLDGLISDDTALLAETFCGHRKSDVLTDN